MAIIFVHIGLTYCIHKALGHTCSISSAIFKSTGIVLKLLIIPPIPRVSAIVCFKPNFFGISKSITVEGLYPPT